MDDLIKQIGTNLANEITRLVLEKVRGELSKMHKQNYTFCFTEEEAAEKLDVHKNTLYKWRRDGLIGYSRSPSGKPVYLARHIEEYLARNEVRAR